MLESVSPYALLRASIPRRGASEPRAYDLYSLAQGGAPIPQAHALAGESARPAAAPASAGEEAGETAARRPAPVIAPARRTHYIADIKTRHSSAALKATFSAPKG